MPVDTLLGSIHVAARVGRLSSVAAALLLLLCSCLSVANVESSIPNKHFVSVTSAKELQEAGRAGVAHIVVQAHLDLVGLRSEPDLRHKVALDSAVIRVRQSTRSIVVRTSSSALFAAGDFLACWPEACTLDACSRRRRGRYLACQFPNNLAQFPENTK